MNIGYYDFCPKFKHKLYLNSLFISFLPKNKQTKKNMLHYHQDYHFSPVM